MAMALAPKTNQEGGVPGNGGGVVSLRSPQPEGGAPEAQGTSSAGVTEGPGAVLGRGHKPREGLVHLDC